MRRNRPVGIIRAAIVIFALGADDPASSPNLLIDGSFEEKSTVGWSAGSWLVPVAEVKIDDGQAREGARSATLLIEGRPDDARVVRKIRVIPNHHFRASGWVKTSAVASGEPGATVGANIGLFQRRERSESLFGDHDWTELSFEFDSGAAAEVDFAARLGFFSSTVTGQAWFDDLRVVDVGPTPSAPNTAPATTGQGPGPVPPPTPPGMAMDSLWIYAALSLGSPLLISSALLGVAWRRKWRPSVTGSWMVGASLVLVAVGFATSQVFWVPAFALFLIAVTLFLVRSPASSRVDGLDSAPGDVETESKSPVRGFRDLVPLIFGLVVLVGSSWFVSMVIFSLLAIPLMFCGAIAVGLALGSIPCPDKESVAWPSRWLGGVLISLGVAGLMVVLGTVSATLGGRTPPTPNETYTILAISGGAWLAFVGIISTGMGLRGSDGPLRWNACWLLLATLVVAVSLGARIWPSLPKSL